MVEPGKIWTSASDNPALSMFIFDDMGHAMWISQGFRELHEYDPDAVHRRVVPDVFGLYIGEAISDSLKSCVRAGETVTLTASFLSGSGRKKWVKVNVSPLRYGPSATGQFLALETDITDLMRKEEELHQQYARLKEAAETLERTNQLLEDQKKEIHLQKQTIEEERNKSEKLLLNILPFEVARQLKSKGKAGSRHYKMVTVVFADFKGFTKLSKALDPKELVNVLDGYFARFDEIIEQYYLEKIKTIGDAYMFAGGLPLSNKSNPVDAVLAGLEIQHYMNTLNDKRVLENLPVWELRIGIHTGPVVAGVIGRKRLAYDIWGDTVNIASRMEQGGHVGMVNVSGFTHSCIREFFDCDYRGKIETKNQEKTDMYFVNRIRECYAADPFGMRPNDLMINLLNKL